MEKLRNHSLWITIGLKMKNMPIEPNRLNTTQLLILDQLQYLF